MKSLMHIFKALGRKDRFAYGITFVIVINIMLGSVLDTISGRISQAVVQGLIAAIAIGLFVCYRSCKNYSVFVYGGILTASIGYNLLLYLDDFVLHSYLILIIMPLVFFFLLPLRQALIASLLHFGAMVSIGLYAYDMLHIDSAMFEKNSLQVYGFGAIFILALGIFYQLAIEETYQELKHANAQKALLLREIHHRIKNNLNKMSSALGLQILRLHRGSGDDPEEILRKNKLRIEAMSLIHETLYRSSDIGSVDVGEYIRHLVPLIGEAYQRKLPIHIEAQPFTLSTDDILRVGTILNELLTNSIKHTSPDLPIQIEIEAIRSSETCRLLYRQQGHVGRIDPNQLLRNHGLGMMLASLNTQELDGQFTIESSTSDLTIFVTFPC
jgi:two-component sensor histidine kinase